MKVKSEREAAQSCPTLSDPMDCSLPLSMGFSRQEYWSGLPLLSPLYTLGTDKNCLILLIRDTYNSQIHRARKYIDRCQGLGVRVGRQNGELLLNAERVSV